jgi:hypothetical protein
MWLDHRVESVEWFVQNQHRRVVGDRLGQLDALSHALAVGRDPSLRGLGQADALQRALRHPGCRRVIESVDAKVTVEKLVPGEAPREGVVLGAVAHLPEQFLGMIGAVPQDRHRSLARTQQTGHQVHDRRFARAVGSDQARDPGRDRQVDAVDAENLAVELGHVIEDDLPFVGAIDRGVRRHRTTS